MDVKRYEYFRGYRNALCRNCKKLAKVREVKGANGGELKSCKRCDVYKNNVEFSPYNMRSNI